MFLRLLLLLLPLRRRRTTRRNRRRPRTRLPYEYLPVLLFVPLLLPLRRRRRKMMTNHSHRSIPLQLRPHYSLLDLFSYRSRRTLSSSETRPPHPVRTFRFPIPPPYSLNFLWIWKNSIFYGDVASSIGCLFLNGFLKKPGQFWVGREALQAVRCDENIGFIDNKFCFFYVFRTERARW